MGIVTFNGVSSKDLGIQVEHPPGYQTPVKDYDKIHVPGKNGDVVVYKGSYQNVQRPYDIAIGDLERDYTDMANSVSEWLNSADGYARLEDSYEPEYYRLAIYEESMSLSNLFHHGGRATINFNCKPQRFLKSGDHKIITPSNTSLKNPTKFPSLPIIAVRGSGSAELQIGNYHVSISEIGGSIVIDSEIQDCYAGTLNKNHYVTLINGYPKLTPGVNEISFSGGVTEVEVIPKWWTL